MRVIASIGLIFVTVISLIVAKGAAETTPSRDEPPLVVLPASVNAVPVDLAALGVAEITTDDGLPVAALHVRATVANHSRERAWAIDASKAMLEPLGGAAVKPAMVNADLVTLPIAILAPGERRVLDLYFPLTAQRGPASFLLSWPVHTPERVVLYAWFERDTAVRSSRHLALAAGWAPRWWFDPGYAWSAYSHRAGVAVPRPPAYAIVTRPSRWDEPAPRADEPRPRETECDEW